MNWNLGLLVLLPLLTSCTTTKEPLLLENDPLLQGTTDEIFAAIQKDYDEYIANRTPKKEFAENLEKGEVAFYCWSSQKLRYIFPGLSQEEVDEYIARLKNPYIIYRIDDYINMLHSEEPLESMIQFLESYNKLVLEHLSE